MSTLLSSPAIKKDLDPGYTEVKRRVNESVANLESWMHCRDFAGYEPFDLVNSPYAGPWTRRFPFSVLIRQYGRRFAGESMRKILRVPASKNCKALGLILGGYCDLSRCGEDWRKQASYIRSELRRLRSPNEPEFAWGYDWHAISLRAGNIMPRFSPNAVATAFCAFALLDAAELFGDFEAFEMAASAARFFVTRLNRPVDSKAELCFSYTPGDRTQIYNSTALVSAFLTRIGVISGNEEYVHLSRRCMNYLIARQLPDGAWYYGSTRMQKWIDSFHTGYVVDSLLECRRCTGESFLDDAIQSGYDYYKRNFFCDRFPTYYHHTRYPIDIHCCSQAILTFCNFAIEDPQATERAVDVANWTLGNMAAADGSFYYQRHRLWTNRMPYMRWGQAWMFKALARLKRELSQGFVQNRS